MKAVQIRAHGGVDVLEYADIPEPIIKPTEVLVRVRACALNRLDLWIRNGIPGPAIPLPHVLGSDIAGEVVQVGGLCQRIKVGQRVVLAPGLSCRQCLKCLEGKDTECRQYTTFGAGVKGGNRELVPAPEYSAIPIPDEMPFLEVAGAPMVFSTAWHMLMTQGRLQPGEDVLVLSASSGIGMAAVQIAKLLHCRVIATAGEECKMAKAKELGADHVINHHHDNIPKEVRQFTGRRGVDLVLEHVGAATWAASLQSLAPGGRLVVCGATTGYDVRMDLRYLYAKQQSLVGSGMGTLAEVHKALKFVFRGQMKVVVDTVFPLSEVRQAHERLERKQQFGKVLLAL